MRLLPWLGVLLVLTLAIFEGTGIDLWVQDQCYDFESGRFRVPKDWFWPRMTFYEAPKVVFGLLAVFMAVALCVPGMRRRIGWRPVVVLLLSMASVPALVGVLKKTSDVYTPSQIERYGGREPYVRVFESYPPRDPRRKPRKPGHGFPAGHASGGFALMAFAAFGKSRRGRFAGAAVGMALGWTIGIYQTVNGEHYLSHTLVTNLLAGMIVVLWIGVFDPWRADGGKSDCPA